MLILTLASVSKHEKENIFFQEARLKLLNLKKKPKIGTHNYYNVQAVESYVGVMTWERPYFWINIDGRVQADEKPSSWKKF